MNSNSMKGSSYNDNANSMQDSEGIKIYKKLSEIQQHSFRHLLSIINIRKGWKVLDVGCGTGNNTSLLVELVGKEGKVIGTDPIQERIDEASNSYKYQNLQFFTDFAKNACKYGKDFDVVISNHVMHHIPENEQAATFKGIFNSLRPGGIFIFGQTVRESQNLVHVICPLLPAEVLEKMKSYYFYETKENLIEKALENGFKEVKTEEMQYAHEFKNNEEIINWFAGSMHIFDYQYMVDLLTKVWQENNEVKLLNNDKGHPEFSHVHNFYTCKK